MAVPRLIALSASRSQRGASSNGEEGFLAPPERQAKGDGLVVGLRAQAFIEGLGREIAVPDFPPQLLGACERAQILTSVISAAPMPWPRAALSTARSLM